MSGWGAFELALVGVLRDVRERTYVVVNVTVDRTTFVQFFLDHVARGDSSGRLVLGVQVGLGEVVAPRRAEVEDQLSGWGFVVDAVEPSLWGVEAVWPVGSSWLRAAAHAMRYVLQEGAGLGSPHGLVYRAWRYPEPVPDGYVSGERLAGLDRGDEFLQIPELGVARDLSR